MFGEITLFSLFHQTAVFASSRNFCKFHQFHHIKLHNFELLKKKKKKKHKCLFKSPGRAGSGRESKLYVSDNSTLILQLQKLQLENIFKCIISQNPAEGVCISCLTNRVSGFACGDRVDRELEACS